MRLIKNEIMKNMSLIKIAVIVFFMVIISFTTIESMFVYSEKNELLKESTVEKNKLEEVGKKYQEEPTNENLYHVYLYTLNSQIEELQNNIDVYYLSWKKTLIDQIKGSHHELAVLQMINDGIDLSVFKFSNPYKYYNSEEIKEELESMNKIREEQIDLLVNGTYNTLVSKELENLKEEVVLLKNISDETNNAQISLNEELIKIKQYIVDSEIKDDRNDIVKAQKKLEELVNKKDYSIMSKNEYEKNYATKKQYGEYKNYLNHLNAKEKRIDKEYDKLWYAMENGIELSNSTKDIVNNFWFFSFVLTFGIVILYAAILSKEYKSGSIRLLLTQGVKRHKVLLSKYLAIIISTYALYMLFLFIYLFIACMKGSFNELLNPEIIILFNKTMTINYFVYLIIEILISGLPTIFIITLVFLISTIRESAILSSVIGFILSLSTLFIEFIIIFVVFLKWNFLSYFPTSYLNLPSFKYSDYFLDYDSPLFHVLDYNFGIIILLVTIIIMYIITNLIFVNKDIRN